MAQDKEIAEAVHQVANALVLLGNAGATTPQGSTLGGLEGLGMAMIESADKIERGLLDVAAAIRETGRYR